MKFYKYLGILLAISSGLVVIPQLLNFSVFLGTGGEFVGLHILNLLTHYGGILNGSLAIPAVFSEYYDNRFLGFIGWGLIIVSAFGAKFGYDLMKLKPDAPIKIIFVECVIILFFIAFLFKFGFYIKFVTLGMLPSAIVGIMSFFGRRRLNQ